MLNMLLLKGKLPNSLYIDAQDITVKGHCGDSLEVFLLVNSFRHILKKITTFKNYLKNLRG